MVRQGPHRGRGARRVACAAWEALVVLEKQACWGLGLGFGSRLPGGHLCPHTAVGPWVSGLPR